VIKHFLGKFRVATATSCFSTFFRVIFLQILVTLRTVMDVGFNNSKVHILERKKIVIQHRES
jgi:hypothetical protein